MPNTSRFDQAKTRPTFNFNTPGDGKKYTRIPKTKRLSIGMVDCPQGLMVVYFILILILKDVAVACVNEFQLQPIGCFEVYLLLNFEMYY